MCARTSDTEAPLTAEPAASLTVPLMLPLSDWATAVIDSSAVHKSAIRSDDSVAIVLEVFIGSSSFSVFGTEFLTKVGCRRLE